MEHNDLEILRHSTSHIMAMAVKKLFPDAKLAIGPAIEEGFYYDFDLPRPLTEEDLPKIEAEMSDIIKRNIPFERLELSKLKASELLEKADEQYKIELLGEIPDEIVSFYKNGDFTDMCRGPHLSSTGKVKAFKLLKIAGAYWRGDEKNAMLQRIYGTAFDTRKELDEYVTRMEEALKRDHRRLGKELDLFNIYHEEAGAGLVYYHPKGAILRGVIEDTLKREHRKRGYQQVVTPHIAKIDLWNTSGHTDYYKENMYFMKIDEQEYVLKPMNCPGHILIFKRKINSYREMPVRFFELGTVYRYERSGVLHGLMRVRGFTQDDAHIFCTPDQLQNEISSTIDFAFDMIRKFGFEDFKVYLSTRPDSFVGTEENWKSATLALEEAMKAKGVKYEIDPGAGVFYGPKIDVKLKDAIGRFWQGPTIQVDFNNPERFDLNYIGEDGGQHRPVMIHRVVLGSMERFIGVLTEHYAGAFPFWLAPVQVVVLPIADRHNDYVKSIADKLREKDIRVETDERREKIGLKIREAQMQKIPYMLIVGDKEVESGSLSVRSREKGDLGTSTLDEFLCDFVDS
ncbi:MAG: threonine--tRNA ligase [Candidatus Margulisiibacteriota bacterium]